MSSNMKNATSPLEDAACEAVRLNPAFSGKISYVTPQRWSLFFDQTGRFGGQRRR